jgi:outer membrane protein OmpA-like peptidoglycan-associated protein
MNAEFPVQPGFARSKRRCRSSSHAEAVKQALATQGVEAQRMATNSVGKEKPFCADSNEECRHLNRRGHFVTPE